MDLRFREENDGHEISIFYSLCNRRCDYYEAFMSMRINREKRIYFMYYIDVTSISMFSIICFISLNNKLISLKFDYI